MSGYGLPLATCTGARGQGRDPAIALARFVGQQLRLSGQLARQVTLSARGRGNEASPSVAVPDTGRSFVRSGRSRGSRLAAPLQSGAYLEPGRRMAPLHGQRRGQAVMRWPLRNLA